MKIDTYIDLRSNYRKVYPKLVRFIESLHEVDRIPVKFIDINDWPNNLCPGVYIHNRENPFKIRRYSRCSLHDMFLAKIFYRKKRS